MDRPGRFAKAVRKQPRRKQKDCIYGIWAGAEAVDSNLSKVTIIAGELDGSDLTLRFVPKAKHVTGLTTTSTVMLFGSPLCIIAEVVGDISLAEL